MVLIFGLKQSAAFWLVPLRAGHSATQSSINVVVLLVISSYVSGYHLFQ